MTTKKLKEDMKDLLEAWKSSPHPSTKLTSYFFAYAQLFGHLRGTDCVFVETGVLGGGSLFMWRQWLGKGARIVGLDLNPESKKWEQDGFEIHIGDQGDPLFWQDTLKNIGQFDALLDDGGHQSFQQVVTLESCLKHIEKPAVIAIEDTHTSYMKDFHQHGDRHFLQYAKVATDVLTARAEQIYPSRFESVVNQDAIKLFSQVYQIQFFGSLVAFLVDSDLAKPPKSIWNRPPVPVRDFRYAGKSQATVCWPDPFTEGKVVIKGGE